VLTAAIAAARQLPCPLILPNQTVTPGVACNAVPRSHRLARHGETGDNQSVKAQSLA
jgi:hypothetical protein